MADCRFPLPCTSTISSTTDALTITNNGGGKALAAVATGDFSTALSAESNNGAGITTRSTDGTGITANSETTFAVLGTSASSVGVRGVSNIDTGVTGNGLESGVIGTGRIGVVGNSIFSSFGRGIMGMGTAAANSLAGGFIGNVAISGTLTKGGGGFKIDHPLDSAKKYLNHSFVESPEMKNLYDGIAILDNKGETSVELPEYFESLNRDFCYQLTSIGAFAPNLYIAEEVSHNRFKIAGGKPGMRVSWQVTGIRHDPWAEANPIIAEEGKPENQQGYYLHPELYDQPEERGVEWAVNPELMRQMKEEQQQQQDSSST
jgi:hypothetical protein